jgi:asparagine synthase (glutamine-hydrolysing)
MEWNNQMAAMHGLEMAFPFLDRDLIAFLMAIPGDVQHRNGVPKAILREAVQGVVPHAITGRTWKADFTDFVNAGLVSDYPRLEGLFGSNALVAQLGYVDATVLNEELRRLRDRIPGGTNVLSWHLADLVGLELWLRVFFGAQGRDTTEICHEQPA